MYISDSVQSKNYSTMKSLIKSGFNYKWNCSVITSSIFSLILYVISVNAALHKVLLQEVPATSLCWQEKRDKIVFSSKTQESAFKHVRYLSVYICSFW